MGVQCKLLGHVRDSTAFEERRESRPNGTVLICREYQVCRRCGDREEMYRNEQVLTPSATEADTTDADSRETSTDSHDQRPSEAAGPDHVTDDAVIVSDSSTDASPSTGDTATSLMADGTGYPLSSPGTDDAVVISDSSPDVHSSTGNGHAGTTMAEPTSQEQIACTRCGREWRRDATSLRDGDLCPACRKAYVEAA